MNNQGSQNLFTSLDAWFHSTQGAWVSQAFCHEIHYLQANTLGGPKQRLLQYGGSSKDPWATALGYREALVVRPDVGAAAACYAQVQALPWMENSADAVLFPLTLESSTFSALDEVDRVLKSMGYLIVFGVNPCSLWGLAWRYGLLTDFATTQPSALTAFGLSRALTQRGYEIRSLGHFYYVPPVRSARWIHRLEIMNELGKMISPYPAGFYVLIARKHDYWMIPTASKHNWSLAWQLGAAQ
ncbi:MAG: hypothetical protein Q8R79_06355 [Legionellaceae bacterium]|nr:hypothetical protein [Legionellaceae bacterium]